MVEMNQRDRTIKVKIVYYGPALGGKTTNLKVLHEKALWSRRGELISVNSRQDRTILCDLLPLKTGGFRGYDLRLQVVAVPGQATYSATRRVVLKGADGLVFVANSATDRWQENQMSLKELHANLISQQLDPASLPLAYQYNKRDLPEVMDVASLDRGLNARHAPTFEAVATTGQGVLETFQSILSQTIADLCRRYRTFEMPPGHTVDEWAQEAVLGMFGRSRLDGPESKAPEPEFEFDDGRVFHPEPPEQRTVHIAMPEEEAPRAPAAAAEVRSPESLTESYAEASAELGFVVSELREERDRYRSQLDDVRQALELGGQRPSDEDLDDRVQRMLRVLVRAGGAAAATLPLLTADAIQVLLLSPLQADPLSRTAWGKQHLEGLRTLPEPIVEEAAESPDLAEALRGGEPAFDAVAVVPLRASERLLALALLYYPAHAALPPAQTLFHLGFLAQVLAGPLEAAAAHEAESSAQLLRTLAKATATAVTSLLTRLPADAARHRPVDLGDMLAPLRAPGIAIGVDDGTPPVRGDAPLLRFALATLLHRCQAAALERGQRPVIGVRARRQEGWVRVEVTGAGEAAVVAVRGGGDDDAESSVVQAIVDLHEGRFVTAVEGEATRFTIDLRPA